MKPALVTVIQAQQLLETALACCPVQQARQEARQRLRMARGAAGALRGVLVRAGLAWRAHARDLNRGGRRP